MNRIFRHPDRSIAAKLMIAIGLLMIIVSFIFWYTTLQKQKNDLMTIAVKYGNSFIDFTRQSTHYSMLKFQREDTQKALENLSTPAGVQNVNIYDHSGKIFFSSDESKMGQSVNTSTLACMSCHKDPETSSELATEQHKWAVYESAEGRSIMKIIGIIPNSRDCYTAACHVHKEEQKILGFIEADLSLGLIDEALLKQRLALTAYVIVFVLFVSLFVGIIIYKIISKPVQQLVDEMEKVAGGDLDHPVPITSKDEMGMLARAFNSMIKDLRQARDQREKWTQQLEEEVQKKTAEIERTHANLIQTEKLASLGRMAAGVAHEINNPLTGVVTFSHLLKKHFEPGSEADKDLNVIIEQSERCSKIINNLLTFARATPSEKGQVNLNDVLSQTIFMIKNQAKFHHIKFDINLEDRQFIITGDTSQFQQIFLNMFINAADAMSGRGTITASTRSVKEENRDFVEIEFTDEGCGIKEKDMSKLFEPFYTTKPVGKGTGLGLSVSHGIVKHLGGHIKVKSTVGKGTSFFVRLPLADRDS
ncbi:MAG: HAMP domain-containing protein [Nitrospiraceae bacterium]|nr:MAG: HAMP domain-containing protein [Nitrospiraceae bacterium]